MDDKDFFWLIGLLEGEGCFMSGPPSIPKAATLALRMCDLDVMERAGQLLGARPYKNKSRKPGVWKDNYDFKIRGRRAVEWMRLFYPHMGIRRRKQIEKALTCLNIQKQSG